MKKFIIIAFLLFSSISYTPVFSQTTQTVIEYKLVYADTLDNLTIQINYYIRLGFQLYGNPFLSQEYYVSNTGGKVAQAMVKYK